MRTVLAHRIEELARNARQTMRLGGRSRLFRLALRVPGLDPLAWLRAQQDSVRVYWRGRDGDLEIAGAGVADRFSEDGATDYRTVLWRLRSVISSGDTGVRYYGGMRFDESSRTDPSWESFGRYLFYLPRFEVQAEGEVSKLICNLAFPRDLALIEPVVAQLETMSFESEADSDLPVLIDRTDSPPRDRWLETVRQALAAIESEHLEKIVLARRARMMFDRPLDPMTLLTGLRHSMPACFHFFIQPDEKRAFLGASPERLYERIDRSVWSEAVAGTRRRGKTKSEDEALAADLLSSDKDRREHEHVRRSIIDRIGPLSASYTVDTSPTVMKLVHGQHLQARYRGTLRGDVTDADLLLALHPTPAVGGVPRSAALSAIQDFEPFDRGWYAGPVGWVGSEGAEFAVAIRSGLVYGRQLDLFSGAGIVAGSEPGTEWAEIEQKIEGFTSLFVSDVSGTPS